MYLQDIVFEDGSGVLPSLQIEEFVYSSIGIPAKIRPTIAPSTLPCSFETSTIKTSVPAEKSGAGV